MLDLMRNFVNNNVLYYGTLFGLSMILFLLICYFVWLNYKGKLTHQMEETKKEALDALNYLENEKTVEEIKPSEGDSKLRIESLLGKMQEDLELQKQEAIDHFEHQQEERSIISYQELKEATRKNTITIDDEEAPLMTTTELLRKDKQLVETVSLKEEIKEKMMGTGNKEKKAYKRSQFISPVYGIVDGQGDYPTIPPFHEHKESTVTVDLSYDDEMDPYFSVKPNSVKPKISSAVEEENRHLDEFLQSLKEFRQNL